MMKRLFVFNPDCELAIANGSKYYMPPANIVRMAEDLAFLPAFLGDRGDGVLVKNLPDQEFVEAVCKPLGIPCEAVTEGGGDRLCGWRGEPWGESPKVCHWLAERGMGEEWKAERKEWYSRKVAREGLRRLLLVLPSLEDKILPQVCESLVAIEEGVGAGAYLVKAPWSSSGKGLLALDGRVTVKDKEWLSGILRRQGYVMLEKRLDKVADFAMEFRAGEKGMEWIGWSSFLTGKNGEYRGNDIGSQESIQNRLLKWIEPEMLLCLQEEMPRMLSALLPFYQGYLGVDMMVYRDEAGSYRLQPCVEINLRYNMGIVALFLSRDYLAEGASGQFAVEFYPAAGDALRAYRQLREECPAVYKNNRILSGYLNLNPINEDTHFVASILLK
ncbi:MAG: hypothetical protein RR397_07175 [Odoribacter sp.]